MRRVDDDRVERTEADQEERARVIDSEDGDGERQPRRDRHGAEQLDRRIDETRDHPVPADEEPEGDADRRREEEALDHAPR